MRYCRCRLKPVYSSLPFGFGESVVDKNDGHVVILSAAGTSSLTRRWLFLSRKTVNMAERQCMSLDDL